MQIVTLLTIREMTALICFIVIVMMGIVVVLNGNEESPALTLALMIIMACSLIIMAVS